ncbi:MAG: hypothetical protein J5I90_06475 [Caldilineales bacterium]|nr:hypothetical protein [Caldilineales bacterium]
MKRETVTMQRIDAALMRLDASISYNVNNARTRQLRAVTEELAQLWECHRVEVLRYPGSDLLFRLTIPEEDRQEGEGG